ncbi:DedA family protein [Actinomadura macra]|uniref:DedA family protein n=1 Tax=Actinomadura macra TaxID=46164 RepID=UPI00082D1F2B|nr:VTT domain-containing protein [Actinomadura macra]
MGELFDAEQAVTSFGLLGFTLLIFAESGILICALLPFLPGDSLLFTAGLLAADGAFAGGRVWLLCLVATVAAAAGDQVGYMFGRRVGPSLFRRPRSRFFKPENAERAHEFFARRGARALILARFVPVLRTLTPIVAGVGRMDYRMFTLYNLLGAALWGSGLVILGFFLGQVALVRDNIEIVLIGIVLLSFVPLIVERIRRRRRLASDEGVEK